MKVLNVGGCSKHIAIPQHYAGWDHLMLDIDPSSDADIFCDSRCMVDQLPGHKGDFDAVYCSHNLEPYYRHDIPKVLAGLKFVLKDDGFIEIRVPNMRYIFEKIVKEGLDIDAVMYESDAGPIKAIDMIYGLGAYIEQSSSDFMCHKTGFTPKTLAETLYINGFPHIFIGASIEIVAYAFLNAPSIEKMKQLNIKHSPIGETTS